MQISFGMIFSIILIIVFLAFAFFGIMKFGEIQNNVLINKFVDNLNNDIDKMWKSSRGAQEVTYDLPKKIKEVCFKDYEKENVYFVSDKNFEGGILKHVNFDETLGNKDELCFETQNKKITFVIDKFYEESLVTISKDGRVRRTSGECDANPGEILLGDKTFVFDGSNHGFELWDVENSPSNWFSPYNYFDGEIYERYEVISQETDRPSKLQFGIWQDGANGENCVRELMSDLNEINGEGDVVEVHSSPSTWWKSEGDGHYVDFNRPNTFCYVGVPLWSDNRKLVSDWVEEEESDWEIREDYHPMEVRATIVAVPRGEEFSGWDCWIDESGSSNNEENVGKVNTDCEGTPGEFLVINEVYDYTDSLHGFKFWNINDIENSPQSWTTPYDYFNGEVYTRFEVISQPTDRTSRPQFGIWQLNEQGQCKREIMSSQAVLNGEGDVATMHSSPNTWWYASEEGGYSGADRIVDFSTPNRFCRLGTPFWSDNTKLVSDWADNNDWALRDEYFPMRIKTTVVAVPAGGEFSGWDCWMSGGDSSGNLNIDLQSSTFAVIGDSMSAGGNWARLLASKLGVSFNQFSIYAVSGHTCSQAYDQLVNQVEEGTDILFSTCGINGFMELSDNKQWYQKIYETAKDKGISKIYMTTMPPYEDFNELDQTTANARCTNMKNHNAWLKNFDSQHEDLTVVDLWSLWHDTSGTEKTDCGWRKDQSLSPDGVHQTSLGYEQWAEEYSKVIKQEIAESNEGDNNIEDVDLNFENYGDGDPTIYWEQDFEDDTLGNYLVSEFREDWNNAGGLRSTEKVRIEQESGNKFMKNYFYADNLNGENGFSLAAGGIDWYMNIPGEKQEELYVSYKMKFSENMASEYESGGQYPKHWLSGKAGLGFYTKGSGWGGAGYKPKPENKAFFVLIMFDGGYPRDSPSPNKVQQKFYEYDLNMECPAPEPNCWGNSHKIDYYFSPNTWYTITVKIKLDTPGADDGTLQYYINGELINSYNDFNFRDYSDVKINMVNMANFLGGSGTAPYEDGWWAFDDFVIFNYN